VLITFTSGSIPGLSPSKRSTIEVIERWTTANEPIPVVCAADDWKRKMHKHVTVSFCINLCSANTFFQTFVAIGGVKYPRHLSTSRSDGNKIQTVAPIFDDDHSKWNYRWNCPMWPEVQNIRWRPLHFQNVYHSLYPRHKRYSNVYIYVFGVQLSNNDSGVAIQPNRKKPVVENPRLWPPNFQNVYLSLHKRYQRHSNGYINVQLSYKDSGHVVRHNEKILKVENARWRPLNFQNVYRKTLSILSELDHVIGDDRGWSWRRSQRDGEVTGVIKDGVAGTCGSMVNALEMIHTRCIVPMKTLIRWHHFRLKHTHALSGTNVNRSVWTIRSPAAV